MFNKKFYLSISFSIILCLISIQSSKAELIKFEQGGASDAPGIIPQGHLQIESSAFTYINLNKDRGNRFETAGTLFRYGLMDNRLEARTRLFGLNFKESQVGIGSMSLGTKIGLTQEHGLIPNADIIVDFLIPIDHDFYRNNFTHSYKVTMDKALSDKVSAITNISLLFTNRRIMGTDDYTQTQIPYVFGLDYNLTKKISIGEEIFGIWSLSGHERNALGLATVATYAFKENFVGTATAFFGLNDDIAPFSMNMGLVYRL